MKSFQGHPASNYDRFRISLGKMKNDVFVFGSKNTTDTERVKIETFNIDDNTWNNREIGGVISSGK